MAGVRLSFVLLLNIAAVILVNCSTKSDAKLSFASYYGNHMVLQQAPQRAKVWGVGTLGNSLAVSLKGNGVQKSYSTVVKTGYYPSFQTVTGVWSIMLDAMPPGGPYTLSVKDSKTGESVNITDVKFGDVWVCGGQSNMQFSMNMVLNASAEIATADSYPDIRLFDASERFSKNPLTELISIDERWAVSSRDTVKSKSWSYFSAVCWLYGRQLYDKLKYPIGLVESVWGGTPVEAWSSPDALKMCNIPQRSENELSEKTTPANIQCNATVFCPDTATCCLLPNGDWGCCTVGRQAVCCSDRKHCCPHGTQCDLSKKKCVHQSSRAPDVDMSPVTKAHHKRDSPNYAADPSLYTNDVTYGNQGDHSQLWNAMIHPLLNMTIYGAIWYQGEANAGHPDTYNCTFPAMIDDWRLKFHVGSDGQTDSTFPFGFVQLAPNRDPKKQDTTVGFPDIRWHQTADYGYVPNGRMKNVFMAVAMDLPDYSSPYSPIHPRDKQDVVLRLASGAMAVAYNQKDVKFQGPFPVSVKVSPLNIIVTYGNSKEVTIKSKEGFELCCTSTKQDYCDPTDKGWTIAPVAGATKNLVTLMYSFACEGKKISGIRYAWHESPCDFKKCAVYDSGSSLPAPPFIYFGL